MTTLGPYDHFAGILERKDGYIDLQIRDRPGVIGYRVWGSFQPINLWGTTTTLANSGMGAAGAALNLRQQLFRVDSGGFFRSPEIIRRRLMFDEVTRGITRAVFDLNDFVAPAAPQPLPNDQQILYIALQQERATLVGPVVVLGAADTGENILGPALAVPSAGFFGMIESTLAVHGWAPGAALGATVTVGQPVAYDADWQTVNPIHLILPKPTTSITVRNLDAIEGLVYSFGLDQQMQTILSGGERTQFGAVKEIVLASDHAANACQFSIEANTALGSYR